MTSEKKDVNYTLLEKKESSKLKKLIETYQKNPYAARVIFFNGNRGEFLSSRLAIFEHDNEDFEICIIRKIFGVSTYISRVENGNCAIFHIKGFTLEVGYGPDWNFNEHRTKQTGKKVFKYVQFRGKYNALAPKHLDNAVKEKIMEFDVYYREKLKASGVIEEPNVIEEPVVVGDGLDDLFNW